MKLESIEKWVCSRSWGVYYGRSSHNLLKTHQRHSVLKPNTEKHKGWVTVGWRWGLFCIVAVVESRIPSLKLALY